MIGLGHYPNLAVWVMLMVVAIALAAARRPIETAVQVERVIFYMIKFFAAMAALGCAMAWLKDRTAWGLLAGAAAFAVLAAQPWRGSDSRGNTER